ncbi:hypothetical protein B296_00036658 [Ensete ventricosum]|uniref:Uncharacterized protein n=1 Tax=Ensete ventricosum TaxID=4639 RepID=A0A426YKK9_ENSVE|nr:hypothetical protein B296_00036658 [Ensete ventricosum]
MGRGSANEGATCGHNTHSQGRQPNGSGGRPRTGATANERRGGSVEVTMGPMMSWREITIYGDMAKIR